MLKRVYEDKPLIKNLGNTPRFIIAQAEQHITPYFSALYVLMDVRLVHIFPMLSWVFWRIRTKISI
jgi:hypothetical protein